MKWYAVTTHIDIETGEVVTKKIYDLFYKTKKTEKQTEINNTNNNNYGQIKYTKLGEYTRQQRLEL